VTLSVNLETVCELNYVPKMDDIKRLLAIWSKRLLSLLGRITVVKTLALSKLTSLFLTIPNPRSSTHLIKKLQKMFFKFLWNDGPDKISRVTITQDVCKGGLRAVDVKKFIQALKVTWIRRLMQSNSKYSYLVSEIWPFFQNCGKYGVNILHVKRRM